MSNERSEAAAEAILAQARAEARARKSAQVGVLPVLYRFAELRPLPRSQRAAILREACATADREFPVLAACFVWLLLVVATAFVSPPLFEGASVLVVVLCALPFLAVRRARVHAQVKSLLRADIDMSRPSDERA